MSLWVNVCPYIPLRRLYILKVIQYKKDFNIKKDLIELVFIIDRSGSMDGLVNILLSQSNAHAQIEPRLRSVSPRLN